MGGNCISNLLLQSGSDIWVADGPLTSFHGFSYSTRRHHPAGSAAEASPSSRKTLDCGNTTRGGSGDLRTCHGETLDQARDNFRLFPAGCNTITPD